MQYLGLFGVLRHALHLCLQLFSTKRLLPVILQRLRVAQIVFNFLFQLRLRHHRIERRLGIRTFFWPDAVTPVNFFNRSLISDTISESQHCGLLRRLGGRGEGSQPRRQVRRSIRQIKSRRKSNKADEKKERGCRVANTVGHKAKILPEARFTCRAQKPRAALVGSALRENSTAT